MLLPKYSMPQGQVGRVVKTALPYGSGFCPTAKNKTPSLILAQGFPFTAARVASNPNLSSSHPGAVALPGVYSKTSTAWGAVSPAEGLILCFRVSEVVFGTATGAEIQAHELGHQTQEVGQQ